MIRIAWTLVIVFIGCCGFVQVLYAQDDNIYEKYNIYRDPVKVFLNKFSITLSTGYSQTNYSHELSNVYFFQNSQGQFIFDNNPETLQSVVNAYGDWLNNPTLQLSAPIVNNVPFDDIPYDYIGNPVNPLSPLIYALFTSTSDIPVGYIQNPVGNAVLDDQLVLLNTDETPLGFEGAFPGIPINLQLHYNWRKFRGGIGYTYEIQFARSMQPTNFRDQIRDYQPNFNSSRFTRFYGMLGYNFYSWWTYDFVAEVNYGKLNPGPKFNKNLMTRSNHLNFGVSIENNWSEYVRVIVRPSFDIKSYDIRVTDNVTIKHRNPSFFLQVGLSINIPEIPRSPMKSDHTQLKHVFTDPKTGRKMEVRGQPIWKRQNPKMGENHRRPNQHMPPMNDLSKRIVW